MNPILFYCRIAQAKYTKYINEYIIHDQNAEEIYRNNLENFKDMNVWNIFIDTKFNI